MILFLYGTINPVPQCNFQLVKSFRFFDLIWYDAVKNSENQNEWNKYLVWLEFESPTNMQRIAYMLTGLFLWMSSFCFRTSYSKHCGNHDHFDYCDRILRIRYQYDFLLIFFWFYLIFFCFLLNRKMYFLLSTNWNVCKFWVTFFASIL